MQVPDAMLKLVVSMISTINVRMMRLVLHQESFGSAQLSCHLVWGLDSAGTAWLVITCRNGVQVSSAMGFGFRCGFLGLLHMEIVQERLEREYDVDLIVTSPTVVYRCNLTKGETVVVQNPTLLPDAGVRESIEEPYCRCPPSTLLTL